MIDPIDSLTFSLHANKGAYALLLGSGISRAARIPTGWEVVENLIRRLAKVRGMDCEPDPPTWYEQTFDEAPTYSGLLKVLARSPLERQQLMRGYFEKTGRSNRVVASPFHDNESQIRLMDNRKFTGKIEHSAVGGDETLNIRHVVQRQQQLPIIQPPQPFVQDPHGNQFCLNNAPLEGVQDSIREFLV